MKPSNFPLKDQTITTISSLARTWAADSTSTTSPRWRDLLRDKENIVMSFFKITDTSIADAVPQHVELWVQSLREDGLADSTIKNKLDYLNAFFNWLHQQAEYRKHIGMNPVNHAHITLNIKGKSEETFTREHAHQFYKSIEQQSRMGKLNAKRDLAMVTLHLWVKIKRSTMVNLHFGDIDLHQEPMTVREIHQKSETPYSLAVPSESHFREILEDYLEASQRVGTLSSLSPLWVRHDNAASQPGNPMTSQAFGISLRNYLREAKLPHASLGVIKAKYWEDPNEMD